MGILHKSKTVLNVLKKEGLKKVFSILISKYGFSMFLGQQSQKAKWETGIKSEIDFWDDYLSTKGLRWGEDYKNRFNPDLSLQARPADLVASQSNIQVLDVGAGPLTFLGKKNRGNFINITAVDPLADEYDFLLAKHQITPLVKTQKIAAEEISKFYNKSTFDLVFARNCIDHAYNPENAVLQMIDVVKKGKYILLEHRQNEAVNENYAGLHQWNFSMSSNKDFLISSKTKTVNITKKYSEICTITCEIVNEFGDGEWLITRILKK